VPADFADSQDSSAASPLVVIMARCPSLFKSERIKSALISLSSATRIERPPSGALAGGSAASGASIGTSPQVWCENFRHHRQAAASEAARNGLTR